MKTFILTIAIALSGSLATAASIQNPMLPLWMAEAGTGLASSPLKQCLAKAIESTLKAVFAQERSADEIKQIEGMITDINGPMPKNAKTLVYNIAPMNMEIEFAASTPWTQAAGCKEMLCLTTDKMENPRLQISHMQIEVDVSACDFK